MIAVQRPGIEPGTSAVLRPRHNQLDHLCLMIFFKKKTFNITHISTLSLLLYTHTIYHITPHYHILHYVFAKTEQQIMPYLAWEICICIVENITTVN